MQEQIIKINITIENNPIKIFVIVLSLSKLSLLFIIVSLIMLVLQFLYQLIYFCKYNFYDLNIDLVYTKYHIDIRKYLDFTYIL